MALHDITWHYDGHFALPGEYFLKCNYLQIKEKSKKSKLGFQYEIVENKDVIVHPMQVLSPYVNINETLFLSMDEHLFLCDCN